MTWGTATDALADAVEVVGLLQWPVRSAPSLGPGAFVGTGAPPPFGPIRTDRQNKPSSGRSLNAGGLPILGGIEEGF